MREHLTGRGKLRRTELGPVICEAEYDIRFVSDVRQAGDTIQFRERSEANVRPTTLELEDGTYWLEANDNNGNQEFIQLRKQQSDWVVLDS